VYSYNTYKNIKYAKIYYADYNTALVSVANIEENTSEGLLLKSLAPVSFWIKLNPFVSRSAEG
jgi:hypothetical protein